MYEMYSIVISVRLFAYNIDCRIFFCFDTLFGYIQLFCVYIFFVHTFSNLIGELLTGIKNFHVSLHAVKHYNAQNLSVAKGCALHL